MDRDRFITITEICACYEVEDSFIYSLNEYGLLEIQQLEETEVIEKERIRDLEKMMRLYYELKINLEGIDVISHMLERISNLQDEVKMLQNKLNRYHE
ncbi:MAG TPA: chaperone modulator CbpM [Salinimicrobium sp.]|nr:chaperone modulator CbpM [Salinimicrobium sp.]